MTNLDLKLRIIEGLVPVLIHHKIKLFSRGNIFNGEGLVNQPFVGEAFKQGKRAGIVPIDGDFDAIASITKFPGLHLEFQGAADLTGPSPGQIISVAWVAKPFTDTDVVGIGIMTRPTIMISGIILHSLPLGTLSGVKPQIVPIIGRCLRKISRAISQDGRYPVWLWASGRQPTPGVRRWAEVRPRSAYLRRELPARSLHFRRYHWPPVRQSPR